MGKMTDVTLEHSLFLQLKIHTELLTPPKLLNSLLLTGNLTDN